MAFLSTVAIHGSTEATHREANAPKPIAATDADLRQLESLLRAVLEHTRVLVDPERHAIRDLLAPLQRSALFRKEAQLWQAALHSLRRAQS
jgi:hypothetical protein